MLQDNISSASPRDAVEIRWAGFQNVPPLFHELADALQREVTAALHGKFTQPVAA